MKSSPDTMLPLIGPLAPTPGILLKVWINLWSFMKHYTRCWSESQEGLLSEAWYSWSSSSSFGIDFRYWLQEFKMKSKVAETTLYYTFPIYISINNYYENCQKFKPHKCKYTTHFLRLSCSFMLSCGEDFAQILALEIFSSYILRYLPQCSVVRLIFDM